MKQPLEGIRILDLTRVLAGPFCTMALGDMGAEVIKVERIGAGDDSREFGPPFVSGESAFFLSVNRNKKSITINLKSSQGKEIVLDIAKKSDILVENFRPGTTERLGIDYDNIKKINPRVIYASISGFGQTGSWNDMAGYDLLVQGMSGLMSLNGDPDGPPFKVGTSIGDLSAGIFAVQGILLALYMREKTGEGQYIDISLLDSLVSLLSFQAGRYFAAGVNPTRKGNQHPTICPYETFQASDGYFNLAVGNDSLWKKFCRLMKLDKLMEDPRFSSNPLRVQNRDILFETLSGIFGSNTVKHWLNFFREAEIPSGPINTVEETLNAPQVGERGMIPEMNHPLAGIIRATGNPVNLSGISNAPMQPPPTLGQHTNDILKDILGFTDKKISRYKEEGII